MRQAFFAIATLLLGACTTPGLMGHDPNAIGTAPVEPEKLVSAVLQRTLKDPYSLRDLEVAAPVRSSCFVGVWGAFHGWAVPVSYNAKNSFGAYVGIKRYYFWFHGNTWRGSSSSPDLCPEAAGWPRD